MHSAALWTTTLVCITALLLRSIWAAGRLGESRIHGGILDLGLVVKKMAATTELDLRESVRYDISTLI